MAPLRAKRLRRFCRILNGRSSFEVKPDMPWRDWAPRGQVDADTVFDAYVCARYVSQAKPMPGRLYEPTDEGARRYIVLQHIVDRAAFATVRDLGTVRGVFDFLWERDEEDLTVERDEEARRKADELPE